MKDLAWTWLLDIRDPRVRCRGCERNGRVRILSLEPVPSPGKSVFMMLGSNSWVTPAGAPFHEQVGVEGQT